MGSAWHTTIGAAAAQGFMQLLTRLADGGVPRAAAALGMVAGPAAALGYFYGVRWLANRIHG